MTMIEKMREALQGRIRLNRLYRHIFDTPEGEEVLTDICKHGYIAGSTFVPGDSTRTTFNEGQRAMALFILGRINKQPRTQIQEQIEESNHQ